MTVPNLSLVALSPGEVPAAQTQLLDWCGLKLKDLGRSYRELATNLSIAKKNKWRHSGLQNALSRTKREIQYYFKIRAAVRLGYLIIPNFPLEIIAVRVNQGAPGWTIGHYPSDVNDATKYARALPAGEGRYVDEMTEHTLVSPSREVDGKRIPQVVEAGGFREMDFPVLAVKPEILDATAQAMVHKVFDRIGIAQHGGSTTSSARKRADPIVCGQILHPKSKSYSPRVVTFFIAWWLDTSAI